MSDPYLEADVIKVLGLLREAKDVIHWTCQSRTESGQNSGQRGRLIQETMQAAAKRISSAARELENLIPRKPNWRLDGVVRGPQMVKWGGGPPPQWVREAAEKAARIGEPSDRQPPPPPPPPKTPPPPPPPPKTPEDCS